jgi:hypothetical protein
MNNDAFAALHTSCGKACRVQDAVALGRHIEWLTATNKILKQDLMRDQQGRVVVARVKTNELLEAAPMQLQPVSVSGRERHASEQGWDLQDNEQTVWTIRRHRHPHENDSAGRCRVLAERRQDSQLAPVEKVLRRAVRSSGRHSPFLGKRTSRMSHSQATHRHSYMARPTRRTKQPILIASRGTSCDPQKLVSNDSPRKQLQRPTRGRAPKPQPAPAPSG